MTSQLVLDSPRVFDFVNTLTPLTLSEGMVGVGLERDGLLVAGVMYEGVNDHNAWMHVAALPGSRWLTKAYLRFCFAYPFNLCGVSAVRGYVEASNLAARRFDEHLGFRQEAVLDGAARDGGDVLIYRMKRSECRYV